MKIRAKEKKERRRLWLFFFFLLLPLSPRDDFAHHHHQHHDQEDAALGGACLGREEGTKREIDEFERGKKRTFLFSPLPLSVCPFFAHLLFSLPFKTTTANLPRRLRERGARRQGA